MCPDSLTTDLYFTSDDYLYHKKCFSKLNFESPIARKDFLFFFPVDKQVNEKIYFEKEFKNNFRKIYDFDGFDYDGFKRDGSDRNGFNRKEIDENGYNRNRGIACEEKLKQAIIENPHNYQYATLRLKHNVYLAIFFPEQGGSFSLIS